MRTFGQAYFESLHGWNNLTLENQQEWEEAALRDKFEWSGAQAEMDALVKKIGEVLVAYFEECRRLEEFDVWKGTAKDFASAFKLDVDPVPLGKALMNFVRCHGWHPPTVVNGVRRYTFWKQDFIVM